MRNELVHISCLKLFCVYHEIPWNGKICYFSSIVLIRNAITQLISSVLNFKQGELRCCRGSFLIRMYYKLAIDRTLVGLYLQKLSAALDNINLCNFTIFMTECCFVTNLNILLYCHWLAFFFLFYWMVHLLGAVCVWVSSKKEQETLLFKEEPAK